MQHAPYDFRRGSRREGVTCLCIPVVLHDLGKYETGTNFQFPLNDYVIQYNSTINIFAWDAISSHDDCHKLPSVTILLLRLLLGAESTFLVNHHAHCLIDSTCSGSNFWYDGISLVGCPTLAGAQSAVTLGSRHRKASLLYTGTDSDKRRPISTIFKEQYECT